MLRPVIIVAGSLGLLACSAGGSEIDQSFAEFCETDTMFKGSEPCRNPQDFSDAEKTRIMEGMGEYDQGMEEMQSSLDAAVEEARQAAEEAGN